jgi:hypothetical protein
MGLTGKFDRPENEFNGNGLAAMVAQVSFNRMGASAEYFATGRCVRKIRCQRRGVRPTMYTDKVRKIIVDGHDRFMIAQD